MRVIAGTHRGRRLQAPPGTNTRPILDRVKVAVFDWLGSRLAQPGYLPPVNVLDCYCGGGSLGIESLSRGAATCTFVESDNGALKCLRENLQSLGFHDQTRIAAGRAELIRVPTPPGGSFDLLFIDPPYPLTQGLALASPLGKALVRLGRDIPVSPGAILIWRHPEEFVADGLPPTPWEKIEARRWGTTGVSIFAYGPGDAT